MTREEIREEILGEKMDEIREYYHENTCGEAEASKLLKDNEEFKDKLSEVLAVIHKNININDENTETEKGPKYFRENIDVMDLISPSIDLVKAVLIHWEEETEINKKIGVIA